MADKFKKQIDLTAQGAGKTASDINKVGTSAKKTETSVSSLIKKFAGFAVATAAVKKTFDAMVKNVEMALKQEKIYTDLKTTVEGVGKAWGDEEKSLKELFATQQAYTKFGDTDSAEMLNTLIELSGDYEASVRNLALTQDLASTSQFNAQTAAKYMGMALAGNVEMLGRYVAELRTTNPEFAKLETQAEKTEYALRILNEKFGGKAQAQMDSVSNKIQRMKNYWGDYREMLGDKLLRVVGDASDAISEFFARATETNLETQIRQLRAYSAELEIISELEDINNLQKAFKQSEEASKSLASATQNVSLSKELIEQFGTLETVSYDMDEIGGITANNVKIFDDLEVAISGVNAAQKMVSNSMTEQAKIYKEAENAEKTARAELEKYTDIRGKDAREARKNARQEIREAETRQRNAQIEIDNLAQQGSELNKIRASALLYKDAQDKITDATESQTDATESQTDATSALDIAISKLGEKYEYSEKQLTDFKESFNSLTAEMLSNSYKTTNDYSVAMGELNEVVVETSEDTEKLALAQKIAVEQFDNGIESISSYIGYFNDLTDIAFDYKEKILEIRESELETTLEGIRATEDYQSASLERRAELEKNTLEDLNQVRLDMFLQEQERKEQELAMATNLAVIQSIGRGDYAGAAAIFGLGFINQIVTQIAGEKELRALIERKTGEDIPEYAGGGIATHPQLAMVGDSGIEGILNPYATSELGIDNINALNAGASLDAVMPTNYISSPSTSSVSNRTSNKTVNATVNVINNNPLFLDDKSVRAISDKIERQSKYNLNKIMLKD